MAKSGMTREQKRARIRADLIAAADALFAERGYWGTSLDEIAERAGVTKGAVYSNFEGKEDLLLAVSRQRAIVLDESILLEDIPLIEILRRMGTEVGKALGRPEMTALAPRELELMMLALGNETIRHVIVEHGRARHQALTRFLEDRAARDGTELAVPPAEAATLLSAMETGLLLLGMLAPDAIPPEYFADAFSLLVKDAPPTPKRRRRAPKP